MELFVTCNCQRHLRISFFLIMWMCSYIQMIDQARLDLSDLHTKSTTNITNTKSACR